MKEGHNEARRDIEAIHDTLVDTKSMTITTLSGKEIGPISRVKLSTIFGLANSYIYCLSYDFDEVLHDKFDSNACLVIHNTEEFSKRLHEKMTEFLPGHTGKNQRVCYGNHQSFSGVLFSKDKHFLYQREYRYAWTPYNPTEPINPELFVHEKYDEIIDKIPQHIDISLGSLKDICEIVKKND